MKVPFIDLNSLHAPLEKNFQDVLLNCLDTNQFILGDYVQQFEVEFAKYCGVQHAIGVASGADALKISLKVAGIGEGDEVIVPAHTFIATWFAVTEVGAIPVPVDIDMQTWLMDLSKIKAKISAKTKAIIPVHLYGSMVEMDELLAISKEHKLLVVEDFAQAHGSVFKGQKAGSFGLINATSFYPGKNLGALGDGGMITTNDDYLAELARTYRNTGSLKKYEHTVLGYNSRLDNLQAGFLLEKLNFLDVWNKERNQLASHYLSRLQECENLQFQQSDITIYHTYHLLVIKCERRDELLAFLKEHEIDVIIHYPTAPYAQEAYKDYLFDSYPITDLLLKRIISLPLFPGLSIKQIDYVCDKILEFYA